MVECAVVVPLDTAFPVIGDPLRSRNFIITALQWYSRFPGSKDFRPLKTPLTCHRASRPRMTVLKSVAADKAPGNNRSAEGLLGEIPAHAGRKRARKGAARRKGKIRTRERACSQVTDSTVLVPHVHVFHPGSDGTVADEAASIRVPPLSECTVDGRNGCAGDGI